jgi:hypothetical protein
MNITFAPKLSLQQTYHSKTIERFTDHLTDKVLAFHNFMTIQKETKNDLWGTYWPIILYDFPERDIHSLRKKSNISIEFNKTEENFWFIPKWFLILTFSITKQSLFSQNSLNFVEIHFVKSFKNLFQRKILRNKKSNLR